MRNYVKKFMDLFNKPKVEEVKTKASARSSDKELKASLEKKLGDYNYSSSSYIVEELELPEEFFIKYPNSLLVSHYPAVYNRIVRAWSSPRTSKQLLEELVLKEEGFENRKGFPLEVISELLFLDSLIK